jgi:DNA-binding MurR/RpiR family transcriptional regulator
VLIAMTCKPYRREVVEAVRIAREQGVTVIGVSDSPASPVIRFGVRFVVGVDTPQFFPSSVSTIAFLETLLSFVIAVRPAPEIVERVEQFHRRRHELGIYTDSPER